MAYKIHTRVRLSGPIWGGKVSPQGMLQDVVLILVQWSHVADSCEEAVSRMRSTDVVAGERWQEG